MKLQPGPDDRGVRVDVFLAGHFERMTRSHIQTLNRSGAIRIDGRQEKDGYRIRGGEVIDVDLAHDNASTLEPQAMALRVYYEDDELAVIEKPAGIAVHPGAATGNNTIVHGLLFHFRSLSQAGGQTRPGIVHRLDKWTSGLMIIAKNDWAHAQLSRAFQERKIEKTYIALVHGKMPERSAEIVLNIARHTRIRTRMAAHPTTGRSARSVYNVQEEIKGFSLLTVKIATGRTHQIRVHLSAIGHPVVGDDVYGEAKNREFAKKYISLGRYFLHASFLQFAHPKSGAILNFESELPAELTSLLERIRN